MKEKLVPVLESADAVLLTSAHNLRYFSGFSGGEGFAMVCKDGAAVLITDSRYTEMAQKEAADFQVVEYGGALRLTDALSEQLQRHLVQKLAFEDTQMSCAQYRSFCDVFSGMEWIPLSSRLEEIRMVKEEWELKLLRQAEQIGIQAFEHILQFIKPGVAELDIALELDYFMRKQGAQGNSFDTIAVAGENSSLPHGVPGGRKLKIGDFLTMDFGCVYQGYCSDMTRTVVLGKANERQKEIYETVRCAQQKGLSTIRAGVTGKEADSVARGVIEKAGYGEYFGHSLGHGVGVQIHELPNLSPRSQVVLKENMVVTCEPGIYVPGFGGVRIEDMVCVKTDGCENFSAACTKELLEI